MNFNVFSNSPIMILSPQEPPRPFVNPSPFDQSTTPLLTPNNFSQWTPYSSRTPVSTTPSRKRSRDESAAADHEPLQDGSYFPQTSAAPPTIPEHQPIYGEGMTLLNPTNGIAISAGSQTGTWYEEKAAAKIAIPPSMLNFNRRKPPLPSRKSQRLDTTGPGLDDISLSTISQANTPPKFSPADPTVDDSTYLLGVGWTRLRQDQGIQAAARGWAKYINNHYPVQDAQILLQSKGLSAYLVGASDGFYLFKEDLSEGRLVGRNWEGCLVNLQAVPMGFEGVETLKMARAPGSEVRGSSTGCSDAQAEVLENGADSTEDDGQGGVMDLD